MPSWSQSGEEPFDHYSCSGHCALGGRWRKGADMKGGGAESARAIMNSVIIPVRTTLTVDHPSCHINWQYSLVRLINIYMKRRF